MKLTKGRKDLDVVEFNGDVAVLDAAGITYEPINPRFAGDRAVQVWVGPDADRLQLLSVGWFAAIDGSSEVSVLTPEDADALGYHDAVAAAKDKPSGRRTKKDTDE